MRQAQRVAAVGRLADHLELGINLQERTQPLSHDFVIVGDQDADRHIHHPTCAIAVDGTGGSGPKV